MKTMKTCIRLVLAATAGLALATSSPVLPGAFADDPVPQFVTSDTCFACHNSLTAPDGTDLSIGSSWRGGMMANSVRDPYWQAGVRREALEHPEAVAVIERECSVCHLPMAHTQDLAEGGRAHLFQYLPGGTATGPRAALAVDGVSCAACHQIREDGFGTDESFGGHYVIDTTREETPTIFGPYPVNPGMARVMRSASGFDQVESVHVQRSELCATCHTLFTHAVGEDGQVAGTLPEQTPYLEWRHSNYKDSMSCQDCHMPTRHDESPISSVLGEPQKGFSQHVFLGGNFVIPRILNRYRGELGTRATAQDLGGAEARVRKHLATSAAIISVDAPAVQGEALEFTVAVTNLAGHKLPTAYPSRRAWLHVTVKDHTDTTIFESGTPETTGAIRGNDNDEDEVAYEPHHMVIEDPAQVQIYEDIMVDSKGTVTTGLLKGVRYIKDNRLLPAGFEKSAAGWEIAVNGLAADDDDFDEGGDLVRYRIQRRNSQGPWRITARLLYQPIGYRWAQNLAGVDAAEPRRFLRYWSSVAAVSYQPLAEAEFVVAPAPTEVPPSP